MSETTTVTTETQQVTEPQEGTEAKTFDEAYVKKLRDEAAKHRTEAKANAAAAAELAKIKEANQSETEKVAARIAEAERQATEARAEALRFRIASKFQVSDEDADLFLTGTDEETLTKQAERLTAREADRKKAGNHVSREGTNPKPETDDVREFARELFRRT